MVPPELLNVEPHHIVLDMCAIVSPRPDYQLPDPSPSTFVWGGDDDGDSFAERMESTPLMGLSAAYGWCLQDNELARAPARP